MAMRNRAAFVMAMISGGVLLSTPIMAQKVTTTEYAAEISFWNRPADSLTGRPADTITSDGAVYRNGVGGVQAVFQTSSDGKGGNFLLNLSKANRPRRSIRYAYTEPVPTACDPQASGPLGNLSDPFGYFAVLNIANMPIGATLAKQGDFYTSIGTFRFHDETKVNPVNPYHCAQLLVVTRVSRTNWRVTTDVDPQQVYFNTAGLLVTPGDVAQLDVVNGFLGNFRMRFGADIYCANCK